ncbi:MAG: tRNA 2-thiouridine(34) synthase MnmA [Desertimonas sp.]
MKVLVAMSGGVDSSVAAAMLRDEGHDVVGVTMRLWGGDSDSGCCSVADVDDARRVAQQLDIDHLVFNFADDFHAAVVDPYVAAHEIGVTPNPCIACNRHLKFDRLTNRAIDLGFDAVATGHHARVELDAAGRFRLRRGADRAKDQSYVLHMLDQAVLARTLFPVGHIAAKATLRADAARRGLRTAAKPDSQDVCFITSDAGRAGFLAGRTELHPGRVIDTAGSPVGTVAAIELVTIGQRKGLGLPGGGPKRYVVDVDRATGTVTVGADAELAVDHVALESVTWVDEPAAGAVLVQGAAHGTPRPGSVEPMSDGAVRVTWARPQRRIAPGQSVVFYDLADDHVLGGGIAR